MTGACTIRPEHLTDADAVRAVTTAAFGQPDEARIVDRLRERARVYLGLVATDGDAIIGHILFTSVALRGQETSHTIMALTPFPHKAFMVAELTPGALRGRRGVVVYGEEFGASH